MYHSRGDDLEVRAAPSLAAGGLAESDTRLFEPPLLPQQAFELPCKVVSFEGFGEGSKEGANAFEIQVRVRIEEGFDVRDITRT